MPGEFEVESPTSIDTTPFGKLVQISTSHLVDEPGVANVIPYLTNVSCRACVVRVGSRDEGLAAVSFDAFEDGTDVNEENVI
jgi:molybdate-binding protein